MPRDARPIADRMREKTRAGSAHECHEWLGQKDRKGYGRIMVGHSKKVFAHRLAYEIFSGRTIDPLVCACHSCDNPSCVNPGHIFLGSVSDNNRDMAQKGRQSKGERRHNAALDSEKVKEIRRVGRDVPGKELAKRYGVSKTTISNVLLGRSWSHV